MSQRASSSSACSYQSVLSEVLAAIVHRLSEEYSKIELKSDNGKKRMTQDVALISSRLAPLSESGSSVSSLETLVKEKPTPRRAIGLAMRGMINRVNSGSAPTTPTKEGLKTEEPDTPRKSGEDEDELIVEEPLAEADPPARPDAAVHGAEGANGHEAEIQPPTVEQSAPSQEPSESDSGADVMQAARGEEPESFHHPAEVTIAGPGTAEETEEPLPPVPEKDQAEKVDVEDETRIEPTVPAKD